jgi:hypothetical protein
MTLNDAVEDVARRFCLELERTFRYNADGQYLSNVVSGMIRECEKVGHALDQIQRSPYSELVKAEFREAIDAAVGSYFRYLEQKGRCHNSDGITLELANLILADARVQEHLRSPGSWGRVLGGSAS